MPHSKQIGNRAIDKLKTQLDDNRYIISNIIMVKIKFNGLVPLITAWLITTKENPPHPSKQQPLLLETRIKTRTIVE